MLKVGGVIGGICDPTFRILWICNPFIYIKEMLYYRICYWIKNPKITRIGMINPSDNLELKRVL